MLQLYTTVMDICEQGFSDGYKRIGVSGKSPTQTMTFSHIKYDTLSPTKKG